MNSHEALYMHKPLRGASQMERRQHALERQKQRRIDKIEYARKLAMGVLEALGDMAEGGAINLGETAQAARTAQAAIELASDIPPDLASAGEGPGGDTTMMADLAESTPAVTTVADDTMDAQSVPAAARASRARQQPEAYSNQLMMSEWMETVPTDLVSEWIAAVCPTGYRVLVIAAKGTTIARSKSGYVMRTFPSLLPGGSRRSEGNTFTEYCILDCIFVPRTASFHVLDIMCWRGHPFYDCSAEFRLYWLRSKLSEIPVHERARINPFAFLPVPMSTCDEQSMAQLSTTQFPFDVDGVLFFHKEAFYTAGKTPLCLWLKSTMVAPVLKHHFDQQRPPIL